MFRRLLKVVLLLAVVAAAGAGGLFFRLAQWEQAKIEVPEVVIEFKPGTGLSGLAHQLAKAGVVDSPGFFNLWVRISGNYQHYQAGTYRFAAATSPADVENAMLRGDIYSPVVVTIAVPEGMRLRDIIERLAANGIGHIVEITNLVKDPVFIASLNIHAATLEGYLYPATYAFHKIPTAREALETMAKTFWQNLPKDYESHVKAMGLSLTDAVTFASLIELETRTEEEKPLISEVIWRRLKDKAPLGIDAALIYGISDYAGDLTWAHLADAKNPYNTRIHVGLPPTPIGAPSRNSLEAVLIPSNFGYYYYVLMPGGIRHHFSKTLAEHNLNVKKLVNGTKREKAHDKGKDQR